MTNKCTQQFSHFLITRFDLRAPNWQTDKHEQKTLSDDWYAQRFDLFERYCLRSVVAQQSQQFHWLIIMDVRTKAKHQKKLELLTAPYKHFHVLFNHGFEGYLEKVRNYIKSICQADGGSLPQYILTSRLDNDDCLHPRYISAVQDQVSTLRAATLIDVSAGFFINPRTLNLVRHTVKNNQFVSLFEPMNQLDTVMVKQHQEWIDFHPRREITEPLWATVVHARNLRNKMPNRWLNDLSEAGDFAEIFDFQELSFHQRIALGYQKIKGNLLMLLKRVYYPTKQIFVTLQSSK